MEEKTNWEMSGSAFPEDTKGFGFYSDFVVTNYKKKKKLGNFSENIDLNS